MLPDRAAHVDRALAWALRASLAEHVEEFAEIVGASRRDGRIEQANRQAAELVDLRRFMIALKGALGCS